MSYIKSINHPGWIYDEETENYISPKGRVATSPGAPFRGQVPSKELVHIKQAAIVVDEYGSPEVDLAITPFQEREEMDKEITFRLIDKIVIGDVTIRIVRATV